MLRIVRGKQNRTFIVILSPVVQAPTELEKQIVVIEQELPGREQLEELARSIATEAGKLPEGSEANDIAWAETIAAFPPLPATTKPMVPNPLDITSADAELIDRLLAVEPDWDRDVWYGSASSPRLTRSILPMLHRCQHGDCSTSPDPSRNDSSS